MYVSPNLSQQIQNRKIELHAELKLCTFIRFKCVLCNLWAVSATLLHFARYSDSGETCSHAPAQHCHGPALPRRSLARSGRMWQQERDPCLDISCSGSASQVEQGPRAVLLQRSFLPMRIKSPPPPQYIAVAPKAQILF